MYRKNRRQVVEVLVPRITLTWMVLNRDVYTYQGMHSKLFGHEYAIDPRFASKFK